MPADECWAMEPLKSVLVWEVPTLTLKNLRPRLDSREAPLPKPLTLEDIQRKLEAAAQRREMLRRTRSARELGLAPDADAQIHADANASARQRRLRLEERLASADANRQQRLAAVVARAARRHAEVQSRSVALKERQAELAQQLEAHLLQAEAARDARLAQTAARVGRTLARVREAAAEVRVREEMEAARRKLGLLQRLERAECSRREALQAMLAGQARHGGAGAGYLPREATRRSQLRRQSSSRKLQAAWRAFLAQRQTTRALAAAFVATGVPFTVPLQGAGSGPAPPPAATPPAAPGAPPTPLFLSADPTPFGTPDPCSSPTSTVRRLDGRLASAPGSITQTPHTTPNRTPAHSVAGSPTSLARRAAISAAAAAAVGQPVGDSPMPDMPATPPPPVMPPLRSIASPIASPMPDSHQQLQPWAGSFERLAAAISAPATLKAAQALLQRLESRVSVKGVSAGCCAGLLARLFPRGAPPQRGQQAATQQTQQAQQRYPSRIFLCAYMVLAHPEVVFNSRGEREAALSSAAADMLAAFEALLARLIEADAPTVAAFAATMVRGGLGGDGDVMEGEELEQEEETGGDGSDMIAVPLATLLQRFDEAWVAYLEQFVAWKSADAAGLEMELIRVAVELEASRLAKVACPASPVAPGRLRSAEDIEAIVAGVDHDLQLIGVRVRRLTGVQGAARLEAALATARAAAAAAYAVQQREAVAMAAASATAAAAAGEEVAGSPPRSIMLARSPSQSPVKKAPRSSGRYSADSTSGTADMAKATGGLSRSPTSMSGSFSGGSSVALAAALEQKAGAAVDMDAALAAGGSNLALMWHLLYDPAWQLPTGDLEVAWRDALGETDPLAEAPPSAEALAAAAMADGGDSLKVLVGQRVKRIAEHAFWDSVKEKLGSGGGGSGREGTETAGEQVVTLLAELGSQLVEVLPAGGAEAEEVAARLDRHLLLQALLANAGGSVSGTGVDVSALLALLDWSAGLVVRLGAPTRAAAAVHAQAAVRAQLVAGGCAAGGGGDAAVHALRLLSVQLKLLRLDAANSHLRLLSAQLRSQGAVAYSAAKIEAMVGAADAFTADQLCARLPHTRAWLATASGQLPQVEQIAALHLPAGSTAGRGSAPIQGMGADGVRQALPPLRSGLRGAAGGPHGTVAGQPNEQVAAHLLLNTPVEVRSWRGLVRLGLVQLVSGEGAIARLPVPETLRLDDRRLHAAQAEFQRLLVLAACLLLVRQGAATAGKAFGPPELAITKRRLSALLADPAMRLPDLAAEVAGLAGGEGGTARERSVQDSISRMLGRGSGALRALTSGFTTALLVPLLLGPGSAQAQRQASLALRRCGSGDLAGEAAELAGQLAGVAAVGEAVCGQWYRQLAADLL